MSSLGQNRNAVGGILSARQTALLIASGIAFWFLGALLIRVVAPLGALEGRGVALFYALILPGTWPAILLARSVAGLRGDQTAIGVTIATATATAFDGWALHLVPALYGADTAGAGAAILWGAAVALILGVVMNRS